VPGREFLGRAVLELAVDPRKLKLGLAAARADALRAVGDLQKGLTNIGRAMSEAGGRMTTGITLPVLAIGAAVAKVGTDFETVMKRAVGLAGVSADAIGGVKASILALGKEVGKTPQELGEAFYFVASAGFTAAEAMDVLRIAAMASAAGLGTTQDVAKVLGLVINAYGHENITAARAADILTAAVRDGTAEADAFASVLGRVVPTAATLGVSFDQVTAAIAAMTQSGLSADEAATSLNQVMVSLLKPTREAEQAMADMGLSAEGLRKQLREQGLLAVLRTLEERFAGNDEAASLVFGNVRALRGVLSLLGLDAEQLNDIFADTIDSQGDLAQGYADTEGSAREFARAEAELHALLIELSEDVLPVVVDVVRGVVGVVRDAVSWFKQLPQPVRETIIQALALAAAIGPVLVVLGALVSTLGAIVGAAKLIALTWIPALVTGLAKLALTGVFFVQLGGAGAAAQAAALGFKAMGLTAVAATPLLLGLAAALGAVLFVWGEVHGAIAAQAAQIAQDVQGTISRGVKDELLAAKAALEKGLADLDNLKWFGPPVGPGSLLGGPLSADARAELEAQLAAVNAALDAAFVGQREDFAASAEAVRTWRERMTGGFDGAARATRDYSADVQLSLDATLQAQRDFVAGMLASIQKFRTDLEGAFGAAKDAELDMNDTLLSIAQKQAELAELDAETSRKIKTGTSVQSLEYRNRREHILAELSELKLHAALIGDDMHKVSALTALLTGEDMAEGLTSPLPEVVAAYEALRDQSLFALGDLAEKGGPAGKTAAQAIATLFNPKNVQSPFHGMKSWGNAAVWAWLNGILDGLHAGIVDVETGLKRAGALFHATSPPGPESPLHFIDVWGLRTGQAWIDGMVGAIRAGVGALRTPLGAMGDPFRAVSLPELAVAASAPGLAGPGTATRYAGDTEAPGGRAGGGPVSYSTTLIMKGASTRNPFEVLDRAARYQRFGVINPPAEATGDREATA